MESYANLNPYSLSADAYTLVRACCILAGALSFVVNLRCLVQANQKRSFASYLRLMTVVASLYVIVSYTLLLVVGGTPGYGPYLIGLAILWLMVISAAHGIRKW
jgi:Trk-type K+ transport system membrane component